jgi:acylphosphatase
MTEDEARLSAVVSGHVQAVGFRAWVEERADELGLRGSVANRPDGRVEIQAEGPRDACAALLDLLRGSQTPGTVQDVEHSWSDARGEQGRFRAR